MNINELNDANTDESNKKYTYFTFKQPNGLLGVFNSTVEKFIYNMNINQYIKYRNSNSFIADHYDPIVHDFDFLLTIVRIEKISYQMILDIIDTDNPQISNETWRY